MKLTQAELNWLESIKRMTLEAHIIAPRRRLATIRRDHLRRLRGLRRNA